MICDLFNEVGSVPLVFMCAKCNHVIQSKSDPAKIKFCPNCGAPKISPPEKGKSKPSGPAQGKLPL